MTGLHKLKSKVCQSSFENELNCMLGVWGFSSGCILILLKSFFGWGVKIFKEGASKDVRVNLYRRNSQPQIWWAGKIVPYHATYIVLYSGGPTNGVLTCLLDETNVHSTTILIAVEWEDRSDLQRFLFYPGCYGCLENSNWKRDIYIWRGNKCDGKNMKSKFK